MPAVTFPGCRLVMERYPILGRTDERHVIENVDQSNEEPLTEFSRLRLDPVLQGAYSASLVNGADFLQPGFQHLAVFAAHRGGQQIIRKAEERQCAKCENQSIPQAQPDAYVAPKRLKQPEGHSPLPGWYESSLCLYPLCRVIDAPAHPPHWFADQSCSQRYALGSLFSSPVGLHAASCIRARQIHAAASRWFLPHVSLRGLTGPSSNRQPLNGLALKFVSLAGPKPGYAPGVQKMRTAWSNSHPRPPA